MKKKIVVGLIAIGLFASFYAGYSVNNQPVVETITTPEGEQDIKETSQGEEPTEGENGKIVNNFQIQQGEEDTQDNPQGDIVSKEDDTPLDIVVAYNEETGLYEPIFIPKEENKSKDTGNPLDGMTEAEIDAWMLDTSDAPKPGDITPQKPTEENNGNTNNQGDTSNPGNTGGNSGGLTDEQLAELLKIAEGVGSTMKPGDPRYNEGGTGGPASQYTGDEINWN